MNRNCLVEVCSSLKRHSHNFLFPKQELKKPKLRNGCFPVGGYISTARAPKVTIRLFSLYMRSTEKCLEAFWENEGWKST